MERSTIVRVHDGLHARPATRFVKLAKGFESDIELIKADKSVSAKSSVKLMLLGVKENETVTVRARGADEIEAIEALIGYLEDPHAGTAEEERAEKASAEPALVQPKAFSTNSNTSATGKLRGVAASEGFAIGPAFGFFPAEIKHENRLLAADEIPAEAGRLTQAFATVQHRMDMSLAATDLAESDRGIIAALKDIACDDELTQAAEALVKEGMDAVSAVIGATSRIAADFASMDDPYLNARADDVNAVGRQICLALLGQDDANLEAIPARCNSDRRRYRRVGSGPRAAEAYCRRDMRPWWRHIACRDHCPCARHPRGSRAWPFRPGIAARSRPSRSMAIMVMSFPIPTRRQPIVSMNRSAKAETERQALKAYKDITYRNALTARSSR